MRVYIIGAGPGDPKLLTLRGAELIASCPVVLYTGSLVPKEIIAHARPDAKVMDSSGMTLEQMMEKLERQIVETALRRFGNNRERVAKELGVARSTLFKRLKEWGLTRKDEPWPE